MTAIDLNLDAGEDENSFASGLEEKLYALVSSVNIACGGHAGNDSSMTRAVSLARTTGLAVGAHPSYPDRAGFGRKPLAIERSALFSSVREQIQSLQTICRRLSMPMRHVKPHGALYNKAAVDHDTALILIEAVAAVDRDLAIVGLANSGFLQVCQRHGMRTIAEAFVDRRYNADTSLRAREFPDALIEDPATAAEQALRLATGKGILAVNGDELNLRAQTLCIHGDSKNALDVAYRVRQTLDAAGIAVRAI